MNTWQSQRQGTIRDGGPEGLFLRVFQALPSHLQTPPLSLRINQVMAAKESNSFPLPDTPAHPPTPGTGWILCHPARITSIFHHA